MGKSQKIKLNEQNPVIFTVIPILGNDLYQFSVSFPEGMEHVQKSLMMGISNFVNG